MTGAYTTARMRKELSGWALLTILVLLGAGCAGRSEPPARPNVLFLFADDQRADTIGAWGNPHIRTPNLDRLTEEGFSFRTNYNLGANSGAVCVPSRAMLNSGRAYFRIQNNLEGERILPELLAANGYTTFATGKWHNQRPSWLRGFQQGRAVFFGGMSDHLQVPLWDLSPDGELVNERVGDRPSSELFADAAIEFLTTYDEDAPFYAYVAFTAPHDPRQPPEDDRQAYYDNPPPLPANFLPQHPFNLAGALTVRDEALAAWPRTEDVVRDQLAEYYALITHLDGQIGRVLEALEASGHAENTLVVYAADHGLALGSHGLLGKQSVYEHSQRSPLMFAAPWIEHGESTAFSYLLDIFTTVLAQTGTALPDGVTIDGQDLAPVWRGDVSSIRDSVFLAYQGLSRSVRDDRYKLIRYPRIDHTQLFDLVADPDEMVDLAGDPAHASRVEVLTALLTDWQRRLGDPLPWTADELLPMEVDLTGRERQPDQCQPAWIVEKYFGPKGNRRRGGH